MSRGFSLLETLIALLILFLTVFAILRLAEGTWRFFDAAETKAQAWMASSVVVAFDANLTLKKELNLPDLLGRHGIILPDHARELLPQKALVRPGGFSRALIDQNLTLQVYSVKVITAGHTTLLYGIGR